MSLVDLIRQRRAVKSATAIPATSATQWRVVPETIARISTIAIAVPPEAQAVPRTPSVFVGEAVTASHRWLVHYIDRNPVEVASAPPATHTEILEAYPTALAAEPLPDRTRRVATSEEADELKTLVHLIFGQETEADRAEALAAALGDVDAALACFRGLHRFET